MKTRERIIHISLDLFNRFGEPNVTTLQIADELDISPGNLYYHYKNKTEILHELFARFEQQMLELLDVPNVEISIEDQWLFLHLIFERIAEYRFLYKDLVNILQRYERIRPRFKKILHKKTEASLTICSSLRDQEILIGSNEELEALCNNIVLTITYWPSFDLIRHPADAQDIDLSHGVYQVMSLVAPYLRDGERQALMAMSREYLT
ncbi:TetR family transcriptional regulator [Hahella sp. KA22]|uniref:TetR/AcrR family transcriptional regulator n=1 Tax=Hahella sp. KA22 TaxID=1628392 RepID=UPI000FDDF6B4|nr:TetR/AcrR family transcriptional regulator [Hahella sp. KA22]AZZ92970.1 TetR/AcrR family transcriptional regulator [Hahella sp. KA22]QAY56344.1 TetR family transcriptional regulator [Hahella sp. KA22]